MNYTPFIRIIIGTTYTPLLSNLEAQRLSSYKISCKKSIADPKPFTHPIDPLIFTVFLYFSMVFANFLADRFHAFFIQYLCFIYALSMPLLGLTPF
jgi:hypothetical protein